MAKLLAWCYGERLCCLEPNIAIGDLVVYRYDGLSRSGR